MAGTTIATVINMSVVVGSPGYGGPVTITGTGGISPGVYGATAIDLPEGVFYPTIVNSGGIIGASGGDYLFNGGISVTSGGIGILLEAGTANNTGNVFGGSGSSARYAHGGTGGTAIVVQSGSLINSGHVYGGDGGFNQYYLGAVGGDGISAGLGAAIFNADTGSISGGAGGYGFRGAEIGSSGNGADLLGAILVNDGLVAGGAGGNTSGGGAAGEGGVGVYGSQSTILNSGQINGGVGGSTGFSDLFEVMAGNGGDGVVLAGGLLDNTSSIKGGTGGFNSDQYAHIQPTSGGVGVVLKDSASFCNEAAGIITGGNGGTGVDAGNNGGDGVVLYAGASATNLGVIAAGSATASYDIFPNGQPSLASAGGIGVVLGNDTVFFNTNSTNAISGIVQIATISGGGGNYRITGGSGVVMGTNASLVNSGLIKAGASGSTISDPVPDGAAGVSNFLGTVVNSGTIIGSAGGQFSYLGGIGSPSYSNIGGIGGAGVYSTGLVVNSGTIIGGAGGYGHVAYGRQGDAVQGGTLIVDPGAVFIGGVDVSTLEVAGSSAAALSGFGTQFNAADEIIFDTLSQWNIEGDLAGLAGGQMIEGFAGGDAIVLDGVSIASDSFQNGVGLELAIGGSEVTLAIAGSFGTGDFSVVNAGNATIILASDLLQVLAPDMAVLGVGQTRTINGVGLAESGSGGEIFTVTLADPKGVLAASGSGITSSGGSLTISGTLAQINADLATLTDTAGSIGTEQIIIDGNNGLGDFATATIAVTVNGLPVLTAPEIAVVGGEAAAIQGLSLAESGDITDEIFTLVLADRYGILSATGAGISGSGTDALTLSGTLAAINADLANVKDLDAASDTISLGVTDVLGNTGTALVTVAVNGLPEIHSIASAVMVTVGATAAIGGISLSEAGITGGETFTVDLYDNMGLLSAAGSGVSGSGTRFLTLTGTLDAVNADLAALKDLYATASYDTISILAEDSLGDQAFTRIGVTATAPAFPVISVPAISGIAAGEMVAISGVSLTEAGSVSGETFTVILADHNGLLSVSGAGVAGAGTEKLTISGSLAHVNADLATLKDSDYLAGTDTISLSATDSLGGIAVDKTIAVTVNGSIESGELIAVPAGVNAGSLIVGNIGVELIQSDGVDQSTTLNAKGLQLVLGEAVFTRINGGYQVLGPEGVSVDTTIGASGYEIVLNEGYAVNSTIAAGGTEMLTKGALSGGTDFAGSDATLLIGGTTLPMAAISGFGLNGAGDEIVLAGFSFVAGHDMVSLSSGNVLNFNLNGVAEKLYLNPAQNYVGHGFDITNNDFGQVVITDPITGAAAAKAGLLGAPAGVGILDKVLLNGTGFDGLEAEFAAGLSHTAGTGLYPGLETAVFSVLGSSLSAIGSFSTVH